MKQTFSGHRRPLIMAMIAAEEPGSAIPIIRNSIYSGAESFGIELEAMDGRYKTEENYRWLFDCAEERPIYVTNYRTKKNSGKRDDELAEGLLLARKAGATLCDVMGDLYDPAPLELTYQPQAVDRQKRLIEKIHAMGGEVLISSHTKKFLEAEKVLEMLLEQEARGADVAKIVTRADSEEELQQNMETMLLLKRKLRIPFIFLSNGRYCKLQRTLGSLYCAPFLLCVPQYTALSSQEQPLLGAVQRIVSNIEW